MRSTQRTQRTVLVLLASAGLLLGCGFPSDSDSEGRPPRLSGTSPHSLNSSDLAVQAAVAENLDVPWGVTFLPDGGALVTERDSRRLLKVGPEPDNGTLRVTELATITEATSSGEGGLMGVAVSPTYAQDQKIFLYYTTGNDNRIAVMRQGGRPEPIVTGIPVSGIHNGGRLGFGPDGFLYASTGDASERGLSQDLNSLGGKILRMTPEGKPAPGNPFDNSLVWSYGHRNVQGFDWDSASRMYAMEFGQNQWDELNRIEPGKNYGWPEAEGVEGNPEFVDPLVTWRTSEASCSGAAISGTTVFAACLRGKRLWMVGLDGSGAAAGAAVPALSDEFGRLRTIVKAPDGTLWVTTSNRDGRGDPREQDDRILRIVVNGSAGVGQS